MEAWRCVEAWQEQTFTRNQNKHALSNRTKLLFCPGKNSLEEIWTNSNSTCVILNSTQLFFLLLFCLLFFIFFLFTLFLFTYFFLSIGIFKFNTLSSLSNFCCVRFKAETNAHPFPPPPSRLMRWIPGFCKNSASHQKKQQRNPPLDPYSFSGYSPAGVVAGTELPDFCLQWPCSHPNCSLSLKRRFVRALPLSVTRVTPAN